MENKIIVAGIGSGSGEYITPAALNKIRSAKFLVGGKRALAEFSMPLAAPINFVHENFCGGTNHGE